MLKTFKSTVLSIQRRKRLFFRTFLIVLEKLLPPADEVWGKVIFLHLFVILFTGGVVSQHALQVVSQHALQGGAWSQARCLVPGGSGAWWRPPPDGYCCGRSHPTGMHSCFW